jgi:hypothetical protein
VGEGEWGGEGGVYADCWGVSVIDDLRRDLDDLGVGDIGTVDDCTRLNFLFRPGEGLFWQNSTF